MSSRAKPTGGEVRDKLKTRVQHRVTDTRDAFEKWTTVERPRRPIIDLAIRLYERDRDVDNSVIGAAVALRVFLFFIPLLLFVVGLAGLYCGSASGLATALSLCIGSLATHTRNAGSNSGRNRR